jgi:hypothetical protein
MPPQERRPKPQQIDDLIADADEQIEAADTLSRQHESAADRRFRVQHKQPTPDPWIEQELSRMRASVAETSDPAHVEELSRRFRHMNHMHLMAVINMWLGKIPSPPTMAARLSDRKNTYRADMRLALMAVIRERLETAAQPTIRFRVAPPPMEPATPEQQRQLSDALRMING